MEKSGVQNSRSGFKTWKKLGWSILSRISFTLSKSSTLGFFVFCIFWWFSHYFVYCKWIILTIEKALSEGKKKRHFSSCRIEKTRHQKRQRKTPKKAFFSVVSATFLSTTVLFFIKVSVSPFEHRALYLLF